VTADKEKNILTRAHGANLEILFGHVFLKFLP